VEFLAVWMFLKIPETAEHWVGTLVMSLIVLVEEVLFFNLIIKGKPFEMLLTGLVSSFAAICVGAALCADMDASNLYIFLSSLYASGVYVATAGTSLIVADFKRIAAEKSA
jgi:hypothetical protein